MANTQRAYNVQEYAAKARAALERLEKTQKPGQHTGMGSKAEVLHTTKAEILALLDKGYTTRQIAEAFKEDVFSILPKTITELATVKRKTKPNKTAKNASQTPVASTPVPAKKATKPDKAQAPTTAKPGTFAIRKDEEV